MPLFQTCTSPRFRVIAHAHYHLKPWQEVQQLCGQGQNSPANTVGSFHSKVGQISSFCNPKSQNLLIFCGQIDNHEINTLTKFYFKIFCCSKNRGF